MSYGEEYFDLILQECASQIGPAETLLWLADQGIDGQEFFKVCRRTSTAALAVLNGETDLGDVAPADVLMALFAGGFEFGVRFAQSREVSYDGI